MSGEELIRREVIENFAFPGKLVEEIPYGSGHINDTFRLVFETEQSRRRYILQRMNKSIFHKPVELMENIVGVTSWLRKKILANGGDADRETLNIIHARDGRPYFLDRAGDYWRAYLFIEGASCYDRWRTKKISTRVQLLSGISRECCRIIRQRPCTRRS